MNSELVGKLRESRLLVGSLVGVDDTLAGSLVELTARGDEELVDLVLVMAAAAASRNERIAVRSDDFTD